MWITVSSFGALRTGKTWMCQGRSREGHRNDQKTEIALLWGHAVVVAAVAVVVLQPEEEKAPGRLYCSLSILKKGLIRKIETDI